MTYSEGLRVGPNRFAKEGVAKLAIKPTPNVKQKMYFGDVLRVIFERVVPLASITEGSFVCQIPIFFTLIGTYLSLLRSPRRPRNDIK